MNATYSQVLGKGRLDKENTVLKTYLLEYAWQPQSLNGNEIESLTNGLSIPPSVQTPVVTRPSILESDEQGFFTVTWPTRRGTPILYLDTVSDPQRRFWIAYSLSDSTDVDTVLEKLSNAQSAFDRVWLWPQALADTQKLGDFRGVGLEYDYRKFDLGESDESTDYFKVQLWGGSETKEILDYLISNPKFERRVVISKIRMKYHDKDDWNSFVLEDLKYNGKFTTKGSSFRTHQSLVSRIRAQYSDKIAEIEKEYVGAMLGATTQDVREPIYFDFSQNPIKNLDAFCKVVFSGHQPFRLWGSPEITVLGRQGRAVDAVDLHTGSKLYFEVYAETVCMALYDGACGNTVARFFTNLQQTFSRLITAHNSNEQSIF